MLTFSVLRKFVTQYHILIRYELTNTIKDEFRKKILNACKNYRKDPITKLSYVDRK